MDPFLAKAEPASNVSDCDNIFKKRSPALEKSPKFDLKLTSSLIGKVPSEKSVALTQATFRKISEPIGSKKYKKHQALQGG
ncbi:hypothetical protein AV530_000103 [Patagioenas fasciata monilis]|uniref:Uncharacterized protein n=1 Tax=Patagioenas fasciata monilis TaxID=372326 RepID=A0A1V4K0A5_PATFA|nr:hypothetical protein AV530_000103 [Patagioenas fasciata monilis]